MTENVDDDTQGPAAERLDTVLTDLAIVGNDHRSVEAKKAKTSPTSRCHPYPQRIREYRGRAHSPRCKRRC